MSGTVLEHVLQMADVICDPFDRRGAKHLLAAAAKRGYFLAERLDSTLRHFKRLRERLAAAALADEVDEVREAALLGSELGLLQLQCVREV